MTFEIICILIGSIAACGAVYAYYRTRDGFHPAIVITPLIVFMYSFTPYIAYENNSLQLFISESNLYYVSTVCIATTACLYMGLLWNTNRINASRANLSFFQSPKIRKKLYRLAVILGLLSVVAYVSMLYNSGGFVEAYSRAKGGGYAESGYVGEALNLSFPAIILLALAKQRMRIRWNDVVLGILIVSPHLLQGTFGGRRGPMFISLVVLFAAWFIAKNKLPSLKTAVISICIIGIAVISVWSQRKHMYIGSDAGFQTEAFQEKITGEEVNAGNTYVVGAATILTADYFDNFYWGYRYFVTLLIRPIPKQIWPTKYEDMGADWLYRYGDEVREQRNYKVLGFALLAGAAPGGIADGYQEFWWGVLLLFFLIGRLYALLWRKHRLAGGFWTIMFIAALVMSIYLVTQSVSSAAVRLTFIAVLTFVAWKFWFKLPIELPRGTLRRISPAAR